MNANKDFAAFESQFVKEEKEILVLTADRCGAASGLGDSWEPSAYFLAYIDLTTDELKEGDGRINWLISKDEAKEHSIDWPYCFKQGTIYRLRVRELADKTVPEGYLPSAYNKFMVVRVLEENVSDERLLAILTEYRKPVIISDKLLGEFELNKNYDTFEGYIDWGGEKIRVELEVSADSKATWTKAMNALRKLVEQQAAWDLELRTFAAEKLTDLANEWRDEDDDNDKEITRQDFIDRITLNFLSLSSGGSYIVYFDDDDMFARHVITIDGTIKKGPKSANIEG